jgi:SLOG in TRPM, prokaryote/SMODS and SLOG-associating 2TM effector domain 1
MTPTATAAPGKGSTPRLIEATSSADLSGVLGQLGMPASSPVVVIVGGAGRMRNPFSRGKRLVDVLDRGLRPAAEAAGATVITGGTHVGVMKLVGEVLADSDVPLIGVAPAGLVAGPGREDSPDSVALDPNHDAVVLTAGRTWGSETPILVGLAKAIRGDRPGVVILANGGEVARYEAKAFLDDGWPVITLAGTGRQADILATQVKPRLMVLRQLVSLIRTRPFRTRGWGDVRSNDVEVHSVAAESPELLYRRLAWRFSEARLLKDAWTQYATFDLAAAGARRATGWAQSIVIALSVLLISGTIFYAQGGPGAVRPYIVALPIALAVASALAETVVPSRRWLATRRAAEGVQRAIYRHRGGALDKRALVDALSFSAATITREGVSIAVLPVVVGRPLVLAADSDEFAALTAEAYLRVRLQRQLRYYRRAASLMRRRQVASVTASAAIAAVATAFAAEDRTLAGWVALLVFVATAITMLNQRAHWQDRVRAYGEAVEALTGLQTQAALLPIKAETLRWVVATVEDVLEREQEGWFRGTSSNYDNARETPTIFVDSA